MSSTKSKYTDIFVPVKSITNGMIILDNNEKVSGIKIMPRNIFIADQDTQNAIIANLRNVYNMIDYEFWIIAADRPVDINVFLSQLQLLYNSVQDQAKKKLIMEDINKANMFMDNNIVDTEYFLLFKERNNDVILKRIRQLINAFASSGLNSHQVTNDDLRVILDNFLNGGQTTTFGTVIG
jgi:DNA-binding ferritin-like protein (Dps family)